MDLKEQLRLCEQEFLSDIDTQISFLKQEYDAFRKNMENNKQSLERVEALEQQMDSILLDCLGVTANETENIKDKIEIGFKEKQNEVDSLQNVLDANIVVKQEKMAKMGALKSYIDGLESKKQQLKNRDETDFGDRILMRHLGVNFKFTKENSIVAVIYKNSSTNKKVLEKLVGVDKENREENDIREDFWK